MCCVLYSVFVSSSNCCQEDCSWGDCLIVCLSLVCAGVFCSVFRAESLYEIYYDARQHCYVAFSELRLYMRSTWDQLCDAAKFCCVLWAEPVREINYVTQQWYIQFCCVFCTWDLLSWDLGDQLCNAAKFCWAERENASVIHGFCSVFCTEAVREIYYVTVACVLRAEPVNEIYYVSCVWYCCVFWAERENETCDSYAVSVFSE